MKKLFSLLAVVAVICALSMTAFAAPVVVSGFDAADIAAYMNYNTGLSAYGIAAPEVVAVDALDGKGVQVNCGAGAVVQSFNISDADTIAALKTMTADKFLSLYVKNLSDMAVFGLRISFSDGGSKFVVFDCTDAVLQDMDGAEADFVVSNGGGTGDTTGVAIPASFEGTLYLPISKLNLNAPEAWNRTLITDFTEIATMEIDVRGEGQQPGVVGLNGAESMAYVLDSLQIVDEIPAETPSETADLSVIAYAVAALTGCGALVVAGKRK